MKKNIIKPCHVKFQIYNMNSYDKLGVSINYSST